MCDEMDVLELAYRAMGKSEDEAEKALRDEDSDIDEDLWKRYRCDLDTFREIVKDLIRFTPTHTGPLSGKRIHGFVDVVQQRIIVKASATNIEM